MAKLSSIQKNLFRKRLIKKFKSKREILKSKIKDKTGKKGKDLFLPLREAFTGMSHGPEMKKLIQLVIHSNQTVPASE